MIAVSAPGQARPVTPVGLLARQLDELVAAIREQAPTLLDQAIEARDLAAGLERYVEQNTTAAGPDLQWLAERTSAHDWNRHGRDGGLPGLEQEMLSGPVEGQLLRMLTAATGARSVLDIGMFTGYSALAMAQALPEEGRVVACELDPGAAAIAAEAFARSVGGNRIEIRVGPAARTLRALADEAAGFDLVFIDADKAGYREYLAIVLDRGLLRPDGLVVVDNTLMQGLPWTGPARTPNAVAICAFNEAVAADERVEQVLLPVRDGVTLIRRVCPGGADPVGREE